MKKNMRKYGSDISQVWVIQLKTWYLQQKVSIMNGAACMLIWRRLHVRRGLRRSQNRWSRSADIEKHHEDRYNKLLENIRNGEVFQTKRGEDLDMRQLRTSGDGCGSAGDMSGVPSPAGVFQHKGRELLGHGQHDRRQLVSPEKRKKCRVFMKIL